MNEPLILFKYVDVFVEVHLRDHLGAPVMMPNDACEDAICDLPFVDVCQPGSVHRPAEIVLRFKHPKEVVPHNLLQYQKIITDIIERERTAEMKLMHHDLATMAAEGDNLHQDMTGE